MRAGRRPPLAGLPGLILALLAIPALLAATAPAAAGSATPPAPLETGVAAATTDGLDLTTATSYTVDPAGRRVGVTVDITAVNRLADPSGGARYYFPGVNIGIQPEATTIRATQDGVGARVTVKARTGYRLVTVPFRSRLYAGQAAHVGVTFVLPAGAPRSASDVRVGAAVATFVAWAFGDRGSIRVQVPSAFTVDASGAPLDATTAADGSHILTATTDSAGTWYAVVDARNDAALTSQVLRLAGGDQAVVRAWPDDQAWQRGVAKLLTAGIPGLVARIGLPWPVRGPLTVLEVHGALLEGYAGFYAPAKQQITISENLDSLTIVHEASHAWFNSTLFTNRWITEGLANEYAARTLAGLGSALDAPPAVKTTSAAAFPLNDWAPPAPIRTKAADARETWGYDASWTVVREVVDEVGEPGMRRVFSAAAAGTTAYPGAGTPEPSRLPSDWRRFVDLAEELGGGSGVAEMIAPWALSPADRTQLAARRAARTAYHRLETMDGGWAAPPVVRMALDGWDFATASATIPRAEAVIATRDAIRTGAAAERMAVPASLEAAYESAATQDALAAAAAQENALLSSLDSIAAADAAAGAPRDWITSLGLVGRDPAADLAVAREAWQRGDTASSAAAAASVGTAIAVAGDAGRLRLVALVVALAALLLLLVAAVAVVRRRSRGAATVALPTPIGYAPATAHGDEDAAAASTQASARPPLPAGWQDRVATDLPAAPGAYPILPPNATTGTPPEPPAGIADEGAEPP